MNLEIPVRYNGIDAKFLKLTSSNDHICIQHCGPAYKGYQYPRTFYSIDKHDAITVAKAILQHYNIGFNPQHK